MQYKLVTYRTTDHRHDRYAVIPIAYVSDLCDWLQLSESAEIAAVTDNPHRVSDLLAPDTWPSYRMCVDYIHTVSLVEAQ